ncbi:uncharacterized protein LOC115886606 [Sitophilus oryzae]|uniref:Uncharacterized protein LOC115886606 n=1 Tax=Sitophilus oryzae TaxID=7048 RepID=A0A6J2YEZ2_SITOR|nr:uncharacterized protein LOC115886606 [Sitophilus oryzae]
MKLLAVVALLVVSTHSSPLGMGFMGPRIPFDTMTDRFVTNPELMGMDTMMPYRDFKQKAHDLTEKVKQDEIQDTLLNMKQSMGGMGMTIMGGQDIGIAKRMAEELTGKAVDAEKVQLEESMQQIQKDVVTNERGILVEPQIIKQVAITDLQKGLMQQDNDFILSTKELEDTLEVGLKAQMVIEGVQKNEMMLKNPIAFPMAQKMSMDFQIQIQKLIEENNMERTKAAITQREFELKQLQSQLKFLDFQMKQLKVQKTLMMTTEVTGQDLVIVEQQLIFQMKKLMMEELALQTVIKELQQVLMSQQKEIMFAQLKESGLVMRPDMMMMRPDMMMRMMNMRDVPMTMRV